MPTRTLTRHNGWDIFIHWFNAVLWLFLTATGLALIDNPEVNPLGQWWPDLWRGIFGGGGNLLVAHEVAGAVWVLGFALYLAANRRGAGFFLREVFRVSPSRDIPWLLKKPVQMTLGEAGLRRLGLDPVLPPQGFYNMGQKAFAQAAVAGGVGLALSGAAMMASHLVPGPGFHTLVSWAILAHYLCAALVFAGLLVHVYMAAVAREERPGLFSMFTGTVPEDYARHHHRLWFEEVAGGEARRN